MRDWSKIALSSVLTGYDKNGNRYLSAFLRDYSQVFQPEEVNAGCIRCLEENYKKLTQYINTMSNKKECQYQLKPKYNGIPLKFGSQKRVFNDSITDEDGEFLLKNHPKKEDLFAKLPAKGKTAEPKDKEPEDKEVTVASLKDDYSRPEMNAYAESLGIEKAENFKDKTKLAEAILAVLNTEVKE